MKDLETAKKALQNNHLFITGGGGVGKSYLTQQLINSYIKEKRQIVVLGSTGISAVNIGGQTIHSFFAFGICQNMEELLRHDRYNKQRLKEIKAILGNAELLVIDEISMVSANLMEMIRYRLDNSNFRGSLLFVGDFFQLPPVKKKSDNFSLFVEEVYAFEGSAWKNYNPKIMELTTPKRTDDKDFFAVLGKIRKGEFDAKIAAFLENLRENRDVFKKEPTILFGRNYEADKLNQERLAMIDEKLHVFEAKKTINNKDLRQEKIDAWCKALSVPMRLELKIGAHVMFCANKWGKYFNGEQGIVRDIGEEYILVEKSNSLLKVEPHEFSLYESVAEENEIKNKTQAVIEQFPIKLSYAITIHKSQGMSIEYLVCDVNNIFEKSQFYVAISRAMSAKNLCILYNGRDFAQYVQKNIRVDEAVSEFYANAVLI